MIEFGNTAESTESDISSFQDSTFSRNIENKEVHDKAEQSEP